jgi:hypothetical protein
MIVSHSNLANAKPLREGYRGCDELTLNAPAPAHIASFVPLRGLSDFDARRVRSGRSRIRLAVVSGRLGRKKRELLLRADDHRLGAAVAACAGRPVDAQSGTSGAIGAGHNLACAARRLSEIADDPEARAGAGRA